MVRTLPMSITLVHVGPVEKHTLNTNKKENERRRLVKLEGIDDLLRRVDVLLNKKEYLRPRSIFSGCNYLSDRISYVPINDLDHYFLLVPEHPNDYKVNIIHGHSNLQLCYASYYCHELGWQPNENYHPSFVKQFNHMWKDRYNREERREYKGLEINWPT
jgi:hypothetical protein